MQYLLELEDRRNVVLNSIAEQGKLTTELKQRIEAAADKMTLEDLYLPYKPKRRTKAQIAREAGLEGLAMILWQNPQKTPELEAAAYLNPEKNVTGSRQHRWRAINTLMEIFSENADLLAELRQYFWTYGVLSSQVIKDKEQEGAKFSDYLNFRN